VRLAIAGIAAQNWHVWHWLEFVAAAHIQVPALSPYIFWRDSAYTRNLIYRDDWFEVMVICWVTVRRRPTTPTMAS